MAALSLSRVSLPAIGLGLLVASQAPARAINPVEVTYNGIIYQVTTKKANFNDPSDPEFSTNGPGGQAVSPFFPAPDGFNQWNEQPWWTGESLSPTIAQFFAVEVGNQLTVTAPDSGVQRPLFAYGVTKNANPSCQTFDTPTNRTCSVQYSGTGTTTSIIETNNGQNLYYAYVSGSRPVPAPLPAVGLAGFLIYSRRLRRRIAKQI